MEKELLEKIKKLLEKARSAEAIGSQEEAQIFINKVNEFLVKYNLSMTEIERVNLDKDAIIQEEGALTYLSNLENGSWEADLILVLCEFNFCSPIYHGYVSAENLRFRRRVGKTRDGGDFKKFQPTATIIGTQENIMTVKFLYEIAQKALNRLGRESYRMELDKVRLEHSVLADDIDEAVDKMSDKIGFYIDKKDLVRIKGEYNPSRYTLRNVQKYGFISYNNVYLRNYFKGAVRGIHYQLQEQRYKQDQEYNGRLYGLVKVNDTAIKKFKEENYKNLGSISFTKNVSGDYGAYSRGREDGKNLALNKGIEAKNPIKSIGK